MELAPPLGNPAREYALAYSTKLVRSTWVEFLPSAPEIRMCYLKIKRSVHVWKKKIAKPWHKLTVIFISDGALSEINLLLAL